jgi:PadR family transcriptional regulator, regulatory protein PadR
LKHQKDQSDFVQGTLDMMILKVLSGGGPMHGYAVARRIQRISEEFLRVEEGSLYPALHRMERRGWIEAEWGFSEAKRKAKYYRLTAAGRAQLEAELKTWKVFSRAITRILGSDPLEA